MDWAILWHYRGALWEGFLATLGLSAASIVGSFLVGTIVGCIGSLAGFLGPRLASLYVEPLRNVPLVVKLFFLYFVAGLDAIWASIISLILHQSAYIADVVSAGLRSIPRGQIEAARALGHGSPQIFSFVLLPQALRVVIPPLTSQFIEVVKNSSVVMLIGVQELTFQTQAIEDKTFRGFEAATAVTVLYVVIALSLARLMARAHARLMHP